MNRLREQRLRRYWTQIELAEKAGVDEVTICHIETGRTKPSLISQQRIADALGLEVGEVFPVDDAVVEEKSGK